MYTGPIYWMTQTPLIKQNLHSSWRQFFLLLFVNFAIDLSVQGQDKNSIGLVTTGRATSPATIWPRRYRLMPRASSAICKPPPPRTKPKAGCKTSIRPSSGRNLINTKRRWKRTSTTAIRTPRSVRCWAREKPSFLPRRDCRPPNPIRLAPSSPRATAKFRIDCATR